MLLRQSQLESEILATQIHFTRILQASQVVDEHLKKAMELTLGGLEIEIKSIQKDLEPYNLK